MASCVKNVNHSFYIDNPQIDELSIEGMPDDVQLQLNSLRNSCSCQPLVISLCISFKDDNVQEALAKMMLKGITIKDDGIVASLSLF